MKTTQYPAPGAAEILRRLALATDEGDDAAQGTHYVDKDGRIRCKGSFLALIEDARTALQASAGAVGPVGDMLIEDGRFNGFGYRKESNLPDGQYRLYTAPPLPAQMQAAEVTSEMIAAFKAAFKEGSIWEDRITAGLRAALASRTPAPGMAGGVVRVCCNESCGWSGHTDRMCGSVGPLCPECGETTEPNAAPHPAPAQQAAGADTELIDWLETLDGDFYNIDRISAIPGSGFLPATLGQKYPTLRQAILAAIGAGRAGS